MYSFLLRETTEAFGGVKLHIAMTILMLCVGDHLLTALKVAKAHSGEYKQNMFKTLSQFTVKGPRCFLEQEALALLRSTGWFQERIRA
mgnify:FL=1